MPAYSATGLVLRRTSLGETDRILTLFTAEQGKLSAVARGARRAGSRSSGATELFTLSRFLLASGKTLDIVTQCEIQRSFPELRTDLSRLARATYLCELLDRLTVERDAGGAPEMLADLVATLSLLEHTREYPDAATHAGELRMLATAGYAPALDRCARCGGALDADRAAFSPSLGGTLCRIDRYHARDAIALSSASLGLLQKLAAWESDAALLCLNPSIPAAAEAAQALRWYVRACTDRELKSADFLDQLRAGGEFRTDRSSV